MPKSGVSRGARRNRRSAGWAALPNALEGQIEEICRDMAVQVKRMRHNCRSKRTSCARRSASGRAVRSGSAPDNGLIV